MPVSSKYHFIGIGGIGMSGLAKIAAEKKLEVSGSDLSMSPIVEELKKLGAEISLGHDAKNISADQFIVVSTDIKADNPELICAKELGCPLLHRSEFLAHLMQGKKAITIAGTHGKTTTSSLMAHVLTAAELNPSFSIGGIVNNYGTNGLHGSGDFFVAEADESDGSFLRYEPHGAIITNVEADHLDHYHNLNNIHEAFDSFLKKVQSEDLLFYCADDAYLSSKKRKGISYGFSEKADLKIMKYEQRGLSLFVDIQFFGEQYLEIEVPVIGKHNALNASAVFGLALQLGLKEEVIRSCLKSFKGVKRRADLIGSEQGVLVYDDYGHHPTEIKTTLEAFRKAYPEKRLIAIFQPHRYTRTRDLYREFTQAFDAVDILIITEIYAARETPIEGISSKLIVDTVKKGSYRNSILEIPYQQLVSVLGKEVKEGDVVITMGAGDITHIAPKVVMHLRKKNESA